MLLGLVLFQVSRGLEEQTAEVARWSEERLSQRLAGDAELAKARIEILYEDLSTRFASLAQRPDLVKAIQSGNSVAISELLTAALKIADLDGAIVLDANLRVLGADRLQADVLRANTILRQHSIRTQFERLLHHPPGTASRLRIVGRFDANLAAAVAAESPAPLAGILAEPVFDDFQDVVAIIVGYRQVRKHERKLEEFWSLTDRGIVVMSDGAVVSSSGPAAPLIQSSSDTQLIWTSKGDYVAKCVDLWGSGDLCAIAPASEASHLAQQIISIGEQHSRSLIWWLIAASFFALTLFALMSFFVAGQITSPLSAITAVVGEVARGNWKAAVPGLTRRDEVGDIARAVVILEQSIQERDQLKSDVEQQNHALTRKEEILQEQNLRFDAALNNMSQGLCMFDEVHRLTVYNRRFLEIYRIDQANSLVGSTAEQMFAVSTGRNWPPDIAGEKLREYLHMMQGGRQFTCRRELADGRTIALTHRPMSNGGWVETHEDVTEQRAAEKRIQHLARHDALTGLANRVLFQERLGEAIDGSNGELFAVLCLDLDGFKGVNDTLGHSAGDDLLRQVAGRLSGLIQQEDTVARLGGDEFAIVDRSPDQPGSAECLARKITEAFRTPFDVFGQSISTAVSIGVALGSAEIDPDHLLRNADLALYLAKGAGRGTFRIFEPEMHLRQQYRQQLERDLREALAGGEMAVYFQPMIDIATNEIAAFEALARWHHPLRGWVSPAEFIPIAEEVGLIDSLGRWVLKTACNEAARWPEYLKVSVNISPIQFRTPGLIQWVQEALQQTGLSANRLELEITESVILHEDPETIATLRTLREFGISISMDDFGTGYSSLSGLRSFPFDKIKLDRSFVRDSIDRPDCAAIVRAVAELGRSLGMMTTAEGIETVEQLENIRRLGYTHAQGFLFSPAVHAGAALELIRQGHSLKKVSWLPALKAV
jgi:diguanylate cyclase (GGDEF)-like protein